MAENKNQTILDSFVTENPRSMMPDPDRRVFERFSLSEQWDKFHYVTVAVESMERAASALNALVDRSEKLAISGLLNDQGVVDENERMDDQRERLLILRELIAQLRDDRRERLQEIDELERLLSRRQAKRMRGQHTRAADPPDDGRNKVAVMTLVPQEEPKPPGLDLDPKLLEQAAKALTLKELDEEQEGELPPSE